MFDQPIFTATDLSDNARPALRTAARLAKRRDVPLNVLYCLEWAADLPSWHAAVSENEEEYRQEGLQELEAEFEAATVDPDQPAQVQFSVALEFPERAIIEAIEDGDYGLAVLGATGINRVANFLLGSVPEDVVRRSPIPVLVVPEDAEAKNSFDEIVAPVDFTACSRESLAHAAGLARESDATLTVVHAVPVMADLQAVPVPGRSEPGPAEELQKKRSEQFEEFLDQVELELDGIDWEGHQQVGTPHDVITDVVGERDADLVVMGTHGRRGLERLFLGSTATKVLRSMPCSVLTVRHHEDES